MSSTTSSENTQMSSPVLQVKDLHLALRLRRHENRTLRSAFVDLMKSPAQNLFSSQESLLVLKNIEFNVHPGERVALLGVNGSGKTTLCRCIAGMLHPSAGQVQVNGECRAFFDTQAGIIPELTGRENSHLLASFLYPNLSGKEKQELLEEAHQFSELGQFLDAPFENYSLGMKARLFLSLVTSRPTDLLILDEVYDNTDQFFQKKMTARLLNFIHSSRAVIFVSHSAELVKNLCNRAIVLHENKIAYDGSVDKAFDVYNFLNRG